MLNTRLFILLLIYSLGVLTCTFCVDDDVDKKLCFDPRKWFSYVRAYIITKFIPPHVFEQILLRIYDDECNECVQLGKCKDCGCDMPEKAFDPFAECSLGNWGQVIWDKDMYLEHRKNFPIKIKVEYI